MEEVLEQLADGQWHAEARLLALLGNAEPALAPVMAAIGALGVTVERSSTQAYRVPGGLELLWPEAILEDVDDDARRALGELRVLRQVDSTNAELLRELAPPPGRARACLADCQSAGRGRRGRRWVSPFGCNLYLSLDWRFAAAPPQIEGLSLAVAVVVADALAAFGASGVRLKWPNDVLKDGAKLGGILLESTPLPDAGTRVVIGIGINVAMPAAQAEAVDQRWTNLAAACGGAAPGRNALAAALLNRLLPLLRDFPATGFAPWRARWIERDAFAGERVRVGSGDRLQTGIARGVDERGALLLETAQGLQALHGGELSLRSA